MKVLKRQLDSHRSGSITFVPEETEDLWHLYNILAIGDLVKCKTMRKMKVERGAGKIETSRMAVTLAISCEKTDFDPEGGHLRMSGKVVLENKLVPVGQFHTMDIELNYPVTITKSLWDSVHFDIIKDATDEKKKADVVAILIDQRQARIIFITPFMSIEKLSVSISNSSKRFEENSQKSVHKAFNSLISYLQEHIDFDIVKCLLVAGPGFVKNQFHDHLCQRAQLEPELKHFWRNKDRLLLIDASSAHFQVLDEILKDSTFQNSVSDTKAVAEVKALTRFMKTLRENADLAIYGVDHVMTAASLSAIDTLLITDELIRAANVEKRRQYVKLVDEVKKKGGSVFVFSSLHSSGIQLKGLTGIAAVLRYYVDTGAHEEEDDEWGGDYGF